MYIIYMVIYGIGFMLPMVIVKPQTRRSIDQSFQGTDGVSPPALLAMLAVVHGPVVEAGISMWHVELYEEHHN